MHCSQRHAGERHDRHRHPERHPMSWHNGSYDTCTCDQCHSRRLTGTDRQRRLEELADALLGTTSTAMAVVEQREIDAFTNLDEEALADMLLDIGVELCVGCGWWVESSYMSDDGERCLDCEPDHDDENDGVDP